MYIHINLFAIYTSCPYDNDFRNIITNNKFRFRFQKFSKYVVGLLSLKKMAQYRHVLFITIF